MTDQLPSKLTSIAWIIAAVGVLAIIGYEFWHPCGMRAMDRDVIVWIKNCGTSHE
jgi:hypothetical protein